MTSVRFITITPAGTVSETTIENADSRSLLSAYRDAIDCRAVDAVDLKGRRPDMPLVTMYVDDEGLICAEPEPNRFATIVALSLSDNIVQGFYGTAVFVGGPDSEGDDTSLPDKAAEHIRAVMASQHLVTD